MNMYNKIDLLESLLDGSIEFEFIDGESTGDHYIKIADYYGRDQTLYINLYELIHILKHYTGSSRILKTTEELEQEEEL